MPSLPRRLSVSTVGLAGPRVGLEEEGPPDGSCGVMLWPRRPAGPQQTGRGAVPLPRSLGSR